jgi:hypothetical protein
MEKKYAGFWWRFLAIIIDGIILGVVQWIVIAPLLAAIGIGAMKAVSGDMSEGETIGMLGALLVLLCLPTLLILPLPGFILLYLSHRNFKERWKACSWHYCYRHGRE